MSGTPTIRRSVVIKSAIIILAVSCGFSPAYADSKTASGPAPSNPPNGSQTSGGTTYTPVYTAPSGTSVGITSTPNQGTPQTPPTSTYGVGVATSF